MNKNNNESNSCRLSRSFFGFSAVILLLTLSACGGGSSGDDNVAPTADVNGPYTGTTGLAVNFDSTGSDDSDGTITAYAWDFGDGSSSTEANPSHTYTAAGTYDVSLMVTDDDGATSNPSATTATITDPVPANTAPSASVNGPYTGVTGLPVSFSSAGSSDIDGTIAAYLWDFGDGSNSTEPNPSHIYTAAGTYSVSLTVTDDGGATDSDTTTASIAIPVPGNLAPTANANGSYTGTVGVAVNFSSAGSNDTDGTIVSFVWSFGDGSTSTEANPTHTYAAANTYNISLTVTDNDGATGTDTTTAVISAPINVAPTADANGPYSADTGQAVNFDSTGSNDADGTIATYAWDFGDGSTSTEANPSYTYTAAATYNVSLTVTDNDGDDSSPSTTTATITDPSNVAPTADANGPYTGITGQAVSFDSTGSADSDGTITTYAWDFGDGGSSTEVNPSHIYTAAGTYTVSLTVTDNDGDASSPSTTTATITDPVTTLTANANGPYTGITGAAVSFSSAGSVAPNGTITAYSWNFGDGSPASTDANPSHTYATAGTYNVSLTITDSNGDNNTDTTTANILSVPSVSVNSTSQDGTLPSAAVTQQALTGNSSHKIFGTNDLGMHCGDFDTRISSILPPFNVLHAQVIEIGGSPNILKPADGVKVVYSAAANPADPVLGGINSSGDGSVLSSVANDGTVFKTNFWDIVAGATEPTALSAYRPFYPPGILDAFYPDGGKDSNGDVNILDLGLPMPNVERFYLGDGVLTAEQQSMPGRFGPYVENLPQDFTLFTEDQPFFINFPFGYTATGVDWFEAAGVPLVAFDDFGRENPWPLYRFQAKDTGTEAVLASSDVVLPISGEANCGFCHNATVDGGNGSATQMLENANIPLATVLDDPEFDISVPLAVSREYAADLNLLRLHDLKHGSGNANGAKYTPDLVDQAPVVCQSCHYTPALDLAQVGPKGSGDADANGREQTNVRSMSNVMHSHHATVTDTSGNPLFPSMPPAVDSNGNLRDPVAAREVLMDTCYQCHPGRRTDCLRGAMANGGMLCQDCHGDMAQVGDDFSRNVSPTNPGAFELASDFYTNPDTPRVPWANEPGCGSCHTGDAVNNMHGDADTLGDPEDGIRLMQAFRIGDAKATPIVPSNKRFAENTVAATDPGAGNPMLYRVSKGHGGVFCEACHGATHGIWPNKNPDANDNVAAEQLQGHAGTIIECSTCHGTAMDSENTLGGPHGMHPVGGHTDFARGDHKDLTDDEGDGCHECHGPGGRENNQNQGTVLSLAKADRTLITDGNGPLDVAEGTPIGCATCHD